MQTSNWADAAGNRQGGGEVFAFESKWDAIRWAGKMDWEFNEGTGTGKISILTLSDAGAWDRDHADPLSQAMSEGRWLKAYRPIPPASIVEVQPLTQDMVRALVAHQNEAWQGAK